MAATLPVGGAFLPPSPLHSSRSQLTRLFRNSLSAATPPFTLFSPVNDDGINRGREIPRRFPDSIGNAHVQRFSSAWFLQNRLVRVQLRNKQLNSLFKAVFQSVDDTLKDPAERERRANDDGKYAKNTGMIADAQWEKKMSRQFRWNSKCQRENLSLPFVSAGELCLWRTGFTATAFWRLRGQI